MHLRGSDEGGGKRDGMRNEERKNRRDERTDGEVAPFLS